MVGQRGRIRETVKAKRNNLLIAGLAVITGGMIYVLCRPSDYSFFQWIRSIGFDGGLAFLRAHVLPYGQQLPEWIVFSLPDGLWSFAYTLVIITIWIDSHSIVKYAWYASIPLLVLGFEFLQGSGIAAGTFCLNDIIWVIIGLLTGMVTAIITLNKSPHEISNEIQHHH